MPFRKGSAPREGAAPHTQIATPDQTTFTLPSDPAGPVAMQVNGVDYFEGVDFARDGKTVTWGREFALVLGDTVTFFY